MSTHCTAMTPQYVSEGRGAEFFLLPSPCLAPIAGCKIGLSSMTGTSAQEGMFGDTLLTTSMPSPKFTHFRVQHNECHHGYLRKAMHESSDGCPRAPGGGCHVSNFEHTVPTDMTVLRGKFKDMINPKWPS